MRTKKQQQRQPVKIFIGSLALVISQAALKLNTPKIEMCVKCWCLRSEKKHTQSGWDMK